MSFGHSNPHAQAEWVEHLHEHDHPSTRATKLRAGIISSVIVAFVVVSLRLYTRHFIVKRLGPDDYLVAAAMIIAVTLMAIALKGTNHGWGLHVEDVPEEWYDMARHYSYLAQVMFVPVTTLTKFSILYSYLRISPNRSFQHRVYFLFLWTALWCSSSFTALVFRCSPIRSYWTDGIEGSTCINSQVLVLASGALNSLTDLAVALLPAPMLWKANLPKRDRGGLVVMFAFAGIVCVVGVARWGLYYDTTQTKGLQDCTWSGVVAVVLGIVETCTGIIGASIPALRPFWSRYFGDRRQSELINDNASAGDLGKGGNDGIVVAQDIEAAGGSSAGAFSYAATRPPTPIATTKGSKSPNSPIQGGAPLNLFKSVDSEMTLGKRISRKLSIATGRTSSLGGEDNEARRVPTGKTWLSLDEDDGEVQEIGGPARFSEASTTVHSLERNGGGGKDSEESQDGEKEKENRRSIYREPTPPLPPGIVEISDNGAFSFAATAINTPVLTAKSSKNSLKSAANDQDDRNAQSTSQIASSASSIHQTEKKRWIPEFTLPFRTRSRGRTLDSTDTYELGRAKS